jgi:hypothetical protein
MTEAEWLACDHPSPMLDFLRRKVSDRKLRLFAVACCRLVLHLLHDKQNGTALEVAEAYADDQASRDELVAVYSAAAAFANAPPPVVRYCSAAEEAIQHAFSAISYATATETAYPDQEFGEVDHYNALDNTRRSADQVARAVAWAGRARPDRIAMQAIECNVLRDIFGNPFRLASVTPAWRTWNARTVIQLAELIYAERAFAHLPILADALEEAGCTDAAILDHCRGGGEHVRGCWVVDLLLGKG